MTPSSPPSPHEIVVTVGAEDIDALGHVNNAVYLRWVQEAAIAHWSALAPEEDRSTTTWVVLRHEIDYLQPAIPGDSVRARTWVGGARGLEFERHTEIVRGADRSVLARARTIWSPVDLASGRPKRVSSRVRALFSVVAVAGANDGSPSASERRI